MNVIDSIRRQIVPIHPDGYLFIAIFAVVTLVLFWIYAPLGWVGFVLTLWCAYFFRDPPRLTPLDERSRRRAGRRHDRLRRARRTAA